MPPADDHGRLKLVPESGASDPEPTSEALCPDPFRVYPDDVRQAIHLIQAARLLGEKSMDTCGRRVLAKALAIIFQDYSDQADDAAAPE
jgi:hypothetical protein